MNMKALGAAPILLGVAGIAGYKSMFTVKSGERVVKFSKISGMSPKIYDEGLHFLIPWIEIAIPYTVRKTLWETTSKTGSRDLQTVSLTVRVISRPVPDALISIHRQFGPDYIDRIMPSICNETIRAVDTLR